MSTTYLDASQAVNIMSNQSIQVKMTSLDQNIISIDQVESLLVLVSSPTFQVSENSI